MFSFIINSQLIKEKLFEGAITEPSDVEMIDP